jgi:hypothetical protein
MSTTYSDGKYLAEVTGQGFGKSSRKGTQYFFLELKILSRYDAQDQLQGCPQHQRVYQQYLAGEIGVKYLLGDLKSLDVQVKHLADLQPGMPNHVSLVGRKIDVVCKVEPFEGKEMERWTIPPKRQKLDLQAVRALDDQFGHLLREGGGQARPPTPVTPNDSDTPF